MYHLILHIKTIRVVEIPLVTLSKVYLCLLCLRARIIISTARHLFSIAPFFNHTSTKNTVFQWGWGSKLGNLMSIFTSRGQLLKYDIQLESCWFCIAQWFIIKFIERFRWYLALFPLMRSLERHMRHLWSILFVGLVLLFIPV